MKNRSQTIPSRSFPPPFSTSIMLSSSVSNNKLVRTLSNSRGKNDEAKGESWGTSTFFKSLKVKILPTPKLHHALSAPRQSYTTFSSRASKNPYHRSSDGKSIMPNISLPFSTTHLNKPLATTLPPKPMHKKSSSGNIKKVHLIRRKSVPSTIPAIASNKAEIPPVPARPRSSMSPPLIIPEKSSLRVRNSGSKLKVNQVVEEVDKLIEDIESDSIIFVNNEKSGSPQKVIEGLSRTLVRPLQIRRQHSWDGASPISPFVLDPTISVNYENSSTKMVSIGTQTEASAILTSSARHYDFDESSSILLHSPSSSSSSSTSSHHRNSYHTTRRPSSNFYASSGNLEMNRSNTFIADSRDKDSTISLTSSSCEDFPSQIVTRPKSFRNYSIPTSRLDIDF